MANFLKWHRLIFYLFKMIYIQVGDFTFGGGLVMPLKAAKTPPVFCRSGNKNTPRIL